MNIVTSREAFANLQVRETVTLECVRCGATFHAKKQRVQVAIKHPESAMLSFCSPACRGAASRRAQTVPCAECTTLVTRLASEMCPRNFCSRSCAAKYNNRHRTTGVKQSRAECFLAALVRADFPSVEVRQNVRDLLASGLEVDILIPAERLAIELNGPVHYFPIYGAEKLARIQIADIIKQAELHALGYSVLVLDVTPFKREKKLHAFLQEQYVTIIKPILSG